VPAHLTIPLGENAPPAAGANRNQFAGKWWKVVLLIATGKPQIIVTLGGVFADRLLPGYRNRHSTTRVAPFHLGNLRQSVELRQQRYEYTHPNDGGAEQ